MSLFKDLGLKDLEKTNLFCDNQAALHIAADPVFHARKKHREVDCHYIRDQVNVGLINPYVHTKQQVADVFTKVILVDQHYHLLHKLGVQGYSTPNLRGSNKYEWKKRK